ncbi:RICIN domain-containing protein [Actinacidiphila yeochonensis]|uniref:RICIN domain-containing protein n=1 Tax=Actinacidiphila yeochonensis TaxID=89050 RepID=UPI0007C83456|nr:RICIN domain-containing protein [Actinacidiphila yeochonensis]
MDRRSFLRGGAAVLGAAALAGRGVTAAWGATGGGPRITLVGDTSGGGLYHPFPSGLSRTPLLKLPSGSVRASGWLAQQLALETTGIAGAYDQVSHFLDTSTTGWLHPAQTGWEEVPYWLRGLASLAGVTGDAGLRSKTTTWVAGILATAQSDGFFGPTALRTSLGGGPDFWPYMPLLQALCTYQEWSGDSRIIPLLTAFLHYQNGFGASAFNQSWAASRWATNLATVHWLFARTGDTALLSLADRIHANGADYVNNLPVLHNVSLAQGFTEPAYAALRGDSSLTQASYQDYAAIQGTYGQFPGGGFAGDENARPGYGDPRQGFETCGIVEYMQSFESMVRMTGDPSWAEGTENLAFNSLPAAMEPGHTALHYATSANSVQLDGYDKTLGQFDNTFSMQAYLLGVDTYRCCPHNYGQGWAYFTENAWLATADNGLAAVLHAPTTVTAKVGAAGTPVTVTETTSYPFDQTVTLTLALSGSGTTAFPLYLRLPSWCASPSVKVNGQTVTATAGSGFAAVNRAWANGDTVTASFPMDVRTQSWPANHDSVSVSRGPLTYSLRIGENVVRVGDPASHWAECEVFPTSAWNYGLVPGTYEAVTTGASGNPFTQAGTPVAITAQARAIPNWQGDTQDVVTTLQPSPVNSPMAAETVTLVPMGAAALRVSSFPLIAAGGAGGWDWQLPAVPSASWCWSGDTVNAINSGYVPSSSYDQSHPRLTWWDHTGTAEWAQYTWSSPVTASAVSVYWYDDTGHGSCRVPASWHVEYLDGSTWQPVAGASAYGTAPNTFNRVAFTAVTSTALRVVAQLAPGVSGGILQWTVAAQRAAVTPGTWYRVQNRNSGKVLGVAGKSTADSANVVQFTDNGTADHLWQFTDLGNNRFTVRNQNSGLLLAVSNASLADSAAVQQYHDNGTADHYWHLLDNGDGWFRVRNGNSGLVLGVDGMSTADSAQVVQYEDSRTTDHLWRFL